MNPKLNIVFFGTPDFSSSILEGLIQSGQYHIKAVVTNPDKPVGRKQILTPSAVSKIAEQYNIPILKPDRLDSTFMGTNHNLLASGLFIVASYGKIIPQAVLDIPKFGSINVHPSILPKYRGASPIQSTILSGDNKTGVSIMLMDEKMDHGPILNIEKIPLTNKETFESLSQKLSDLGTKLLLKTIPMFTGGKIKPKLQNHKLATFCKLIKKEDGYFDLPLDRQKLDLQKLDRMIRAYYPWPTTWTIWKEKRVNFLPNGLIQIEGKKPTTLKAFVNGYPNFPLKNLL